jgi:hypothetical protein
MLKMNVWQFSEKAVVDSIQTMRKSSTVPNGTIDTGFHSTGQGTSGVYGQGYVLSVSIHAMF